MMRNQANMSFLPNLVAFDAQRRRRCDHCNPERSIPDYIDL